MKEACADMWEGFPTVIKAVFPNAAIVIDRFRVIKLVNKLFRMWLTIEDKFRFDRKKMVFWIEIVNKNALGSVL